MNWHAIVVITVCAVLAVVTGGPLTKAVFSLVDRASERAEREQAARLAEPSEGVELPFESEFGRNSDSKAGDDSRGVTDAAVILRGGAWIGMLERVAVFAAMVGGWKEALTIILAVKALGRYPELRNDTSAAVAERFIIGTFVSVLWACAWAGIALWLK